MKYYLLLIPLLPLLAACSNKDAVEAETAAAPEDVNVTLTPAQIKNAGIETGKMEQRNIATLLKVNGRVDVPPQNIVSISVPLGGYLKTTKLLPGMHINKGEVIAVVEDQAYIQLQQDYLTAKANIGYLENEYNRQRELNSTQASSDKIYQQSEAAYRSQRVLINSLAEKLKLAGINSNRVSETSISRSINVYSPIDGYVSKVNVNIGKYVSPTDVLFELINPTDIHLALKVFERDLDKIYIGQPLMAYTNNQPDNMHPCEILLIAKNLSAERSAEVHCHFEDYDKTLIPGTYMNAVIEVKSNKVFVLPADAIVRFEGKQYVYKETGEGRFQMVEVSLGETENGFTEIVSTAVPGAHEASYAIKGAYSLLMMMKNTAD